MSSTIGTQSITSATPILRWKHQPFEEAFEHHEEETPVTRFNPAPDMGMFSWDDDQILFVGDYTQTKLLSTPGEKVSEERCGVVLVDRKKTHGEAWIVLEQNQMLIVISHVLSFCGLLPKMEQQTKTPHRNPQEKQYVFLIFNESYPLGNGNKTL